MGPTSITGTAMREAPDPEPSRRERSPARERDLQLFCKETIEKRLGSSPWGEMSFLLRTNQLERGSHGVGEGGGIIAADRQPAASFGAVERKGRHDEVAPGGKASLRQGEIVPSVLFGSEK